MTETTNVEKEGILPENEYWKQLILLFEAYKLQDQQERLKKKLKELQKDIKKNFSNQNIQRLNALKILVNELIQKKDQITTKILDSFNIYKIREQVNNLRGYLAELNKAFKKKKIDVNTYRITNDYYNKQFNIHLKNLERLKLIAKEYILTLKNEEIELYSEYNYNKGRKLNNKPKSVSKDFKNRKNVIKQKICFLKVEIINNS